MKNKDIKNLLQWYQEEKRDLPWRHTTDSYKIWISEVMLQQTRVEAVKEYYRRFLKEIPTLSHLAHVSDDVLYKLWEGLGYYSRAKNLKKCAQKVLSLGLWQLPSDELLLRKLPGIGPYTAGAILSIAYHQRTPAIDGNVIRVLSRVFEEDRDMSLKHVRKEYEELLSSFMTEDNSRDFTEAFIELGAVICLPKGMPKCNLCPFRPICKSYQNNTISQYPIKKKSNPRKIIRKTVFVFIYDGKIGIRKITSELLSGLYELPNVDQFYQQDEAVSFLKEKNYAVRNIAFLGNFKHIFTHLEWHMVCYVVHLDAIVQNYSFVSFEEIHEKYSLPTAYRKIFQKIK